MGRLSLDVGNFRMKLPWTKPTENYADTSYTDALVAALIRQARGRTAGTALTTETGALESAAGLVGRAFMACEVSGDPVHVAALSPQVMEMIGRALLRRGDAVFYLDTSDGLHLLPAQTHSIDGGPMPSSWTYDLTLAGPGQLRTLRPVQAEGVLHFRYGCDVETPWRGNAPLGVARAIGDLVAEATTYLTQESSKPRGAFLGTPKDGADETISQLRADVKTAAGALLFVESQDEEWEGGGKATGGWNVKHFGPTVGAGMVEVAKMARAEALAALGLNEALFGGADSAALREAWRLALFSLIAPLGHLVESELRAKIDPGISLSWTELRASDLAGRARAWQSLVKGGMDLREASAIAGLMVD